MEETVKIHKEITGENTCKIFQIFVIVYERVETIAGIENNACSPYPWRFGKNLLSQCIVAMTE